MLPPTAGEMEAALWAYFGLSGADQPLARLERAMRQEGMLQLGPAGGAPHPEFIDGTPFAVGHFVVPRGLRARERRAAFARVLAVAWLGEHAPGASPALVRQLAQRLLSARGPSRASRRAA